MDRSEPGTTQRLPEPICRDGSDGGMVCVLPSGHQGYHRDDAEPFWNAWFQMAVLDA